MSDREMLVKLAAISWESFRESLSGLSEEMSWASVECQPGQYLHTEGSILSQIAHVANGKTIYGSVGFRGTEVRWRELSPKIDSIWRHLDKVIEWLEEAHAYWMASWSDLDDFDAPRPRFDGSLVPAWKLISTVTMHDEYHAGQVHLQRSILKPSPTPPPMEGALWQHYCEGFPCW